MLGIGYVSIRRIQYSYSACLRKLASPWNIGQYNCNKDGRKGENQQCVYWTILGYYDNCQIINCIYSKKHHEATNSCLDSIREIWHSWVLGIKGPNCFNIWCLRLVIIISGSTCAAQIWRDHKQTFRTLSRAPLSANYKAGFQQRLYSYA